MLPLAYMLTKSFNLFQYRACGGRPDESMPVRKGVIVEIIDLPKKSFHASECTLAPGVLGDDIDTVSPIGSAWKHTRREP